MSAQMNLAMSVSGDEVERPEQQALWLRMAGRDWLAPIILLLLCLCLYLPGLMTVPPLDRDEPRFAQASKQMMETGNYVSIHYQELARNKKPIGIYWTQVGVAKLLGYGERAPIWVYRLPSVIGAIAAVLLTYWAGRAFFREQEAFLGALLVGLALILNVEAHLAKTDAVLLACVMLSQGALARVWTAQQSKALWTYAMLFWFGLALGTLIKGPIILMVCGLTILSLSVWERRVSWLGGLAPISGFLLFLALVTPWLVAIYIETSGAFFRDALGADLWGKVGTGRESHGAPPLTHLLISFVIFWPIPSFLLVIFKGIRQELNQVCYRFLLCWLIPSWVIFELVSTKLPHYTLPMMPALALLTAGVLTTDGAKQVGIYWRYASAFLFLLVPLGIFIAVVVGPLLLDLWPSPPGVVLCGLAVIAALSATRKLIAGELIGALPTVGASALLMFVGFWAFSGPALSTIWISSRLAEAVEQLPGCERKDVATAGFYEPSFVFLQGTQTKLLGAEAAARFLADGSQRSGVSKGTCRIVLVEGRQLDRFDAEALRLGMRTSEVSTVSGLNINGGKALLIHIFSAGGATQ
ncbi:glycosyltransferase family 39 protein [Pseudovibrio sp. Ad26]|uniref:ArnT family glycosyltransferase n=1 Tax=Pseudovibrio sp. Ad26 TaxID=989410 RepID=UPI0007B1FDEB|nr:glycosyltransferase family 39 protein [Pseudovibrio sp. Ad26]KZL06437.1 Undecaprenyl phosphate-alpha-4-amino-4-deoxy-L-arabinose arabinosyl transferase [Pseudovibrio sp. Ad26]